eukprot:11163741-Lingulodinium_polyedra.AAC.1
MSCAESRQWMGVITHTTSPPGAPAFGAPSGRGSPSWCSLQRFLLHSGPLMPRVGSLLPDK